MFSAGVVGAAMAAAIVSALACAWGLGEIFGLRRSLEYEARHRLGFFSGYTAWVVGSALLVLFAPDLVRLSVGMQVLNALLLPIVFTLLVILAATALPESVRLSGWRLWLTAGIVGLAAAAGWRARSRDCDDRSWLRPFGRRSRNPCGQSARQPDQMRCDQCVAATGPPNVEVSNAGPPFGLSGSAATSIAQ